MYPQTVLITGGATGIGFALAKKFHDAGHQIILVGRRRERLEAAVAALPGARAYVADITLALDRERLRERFPEVSILINNAGIQNSGGILEQTSEQMAREVWVNFLAPVFLTQAFLPALLAHPGGAVVNITSGLALAPKAGAPVYSAAKAALRSFTRSLRRQLRGTPIRVVEVLPPLVDTAMTAGRGQGKMSPDGVADAFWRGFLAGQEEIVVGKTRWLALLARLSPGLAESILARA